MLSASLRRFAFQQQQRRHPHQWMAAAVAAAAAGSSYWVLLVTSQQEHPEEENDEHHHQVNGRPHPHHRWRPSFSGMVTALEETANNSNNNNLLQQPQPLQDLPTRAQQLHHLQQASSPAAKEHQFDVLVIGGGATGAGTALDAQLRGLKTALIERGDFGNETSARSTKLIWAGIRYIGTAIAQLLDWRNLTRPVAACREFGSEFRLVLAAQRERRLLMQNNPHLTAWVPIAVPVSSWIEWPPPFGHTIFSVAPLTLPAVMKFYDSLGGFCSPPSHVMGHKRSQRKFPQLNTEHNHVKYSQIFYEGQHNDARTATYIALTAAEYGATVANHVEMIGVLRENDKSDGKAVGIKCRDNLTGHVFDVYARSIIFCGGPFTDAMRLLEDPQAKPAVQGAAGTHIVLPGYYSPDGIGMLDINTSDGRFLFFLPWQGSTVVGTTDRKDAVVSSPEPPEEEIQWILTEVRKYLSPELKVRRSDVLSAWQGFRPLAVDPHAPPGAPVSRDHVISTHPETGVTFITGGKWTTYREMAEDVLNRVIEQHQLTHAGPCRTHQVPLRGGVGYTKTVPIRLVQEFGVSEETAKHLAKTYGMHAFDLCRSTEPTGKRWPRFGQILVEGYPYLECEVDYACQKEMVCTLTDMLTLRFRLAYLNKDAALAVAPKVADLMQASLGWSRKERNRQLEEAKKYLSSFGGPIPNQLEASSTSSTVVTVQNVHELFVGHFDRSENGYMDLIDFENALMMLGYPFDNDKQALREFRKLDIQNKGRVTEEEFVAWWQSRDKKRDSLRRKLNQKFRVVNEE